MAAKKQELVSEREALKKSIAKGKLKGRALKKAIGRVYYLNGRLNHKVEQKTRKPGRPKKAHVVSKDQRFLPGFLAQMDTVRIQELMTEKLSKAIDQKVTEIVNGVMSKVKVG